MKITRPKIPTTGTLLTNTESVSPTWRIPNRPDTGAFESHDRPDPTLALDCPLFELTHEGAAHWMAMGGWTQDEAALLLAGANPLRIREFDADPNTYKPDFTSCGHPGLALRLQRAQVMDVLAFPCPPLRVIEWAKSKHAIPAPLEALLPAQCATTVSPATGEPAPATQAPPVAGKTWTPERLAEVKAYRDAHGTNATALHFGISGALIRQKLPGQKTAQGGHSVFTHRIK